MEKQLAKRMVDGLLRLVGRLRAEQRWLGGRPVRAIKVGRAELAFLRSQQKMAPTTFGALAPMGIWFWGIPCYEVDLSSYFEPIYQDEAPTLEALNGRLMQEPRAIWGKVEAG